MSATSWTVDVADEAATERLATELGASLGARALITLDGPLGAGKTRFVRGLAVALEIDPRNVSSPTFTLVHEYPGRRPLIHLDAYRLRSPEELLDLGIDDYLAVDGWVVIEWGERVERVLPAERWAVRIDVTGETSRRFTLTRHHASG